MVHRYSKSYNHKIKMNVKHRLVGKMTLKLWKHTRHWKINKRNYITEKYNTTRTIPLNILLRRNSYANDSRTSTTTGICYDAYDKHVFSEMSQSLNSNIEKYKYHLWSRKSCRRAYFSYTYCILQLSVFNINVWYDCLHYNFLLLFSYVHACWWILIW